MINLVFRLDASKKIGGGHLSRCISIAEHGLGYDNFKVHFISNYKDDILNKKLSKIPHILINPQTNYENFNYKKDLKFTLNYLKNLTNIILIVDHYKIDSKWEKIIKKKCAKLIVIDDHANRRHFCDIVLDQNLVNNYKTRYHSLVNRDCKLLLGPKYALLGPEYKNVKRNKSFKSKKINISIFFGSYDFHSLTYEILSILIYKINLNDFKISIILDENHPDYQKIQKLISNYKNILIKKIGISLINLLKSTDILIGSYGVNFWERTIFDIKSIIICTNKDQNKFVKYLEDKNYCINLGTYNNYSANKLILNLKNIIEKKKLITNKIQIDGLGCMRLIDYISNKSNVLKIRNVQKYDLFLLYQWVNHSMLRKYSFNKKKVKFKDHSIWFEKNFDLNSFYICINKFDNEIGMVRFNKIENLYFVSFLVDPFYQMKNYGLKILRNSLNKFTKNKNIHIYAKVLFENKASIKIFEKLCFKKTEFIDYILYSKEYKRKI